MHHGVLMVVRGQLVGTGSLIPACGYQGWSSGGCSFFSKSLYLLNHLVLMHGQVHKLLDFSMMLLAHWSA